METFALVIEASKKNNNVALLKILYIHYLLYFQKDTNKIQTLLDLSNKVNTIILIYTLKLGF